MAPDEAEAEFESNLVEVIRAVPPFTIAPPFSAWLEATEQFVSSRVPKFKIAPPSWFFPLARLSLSSLTVTVFHTLIMPFAFRPEMVSRSFPVTFRLSVMSGRALFSAIVVAGWTMMYGIPPMT
ncbi:hypothetical protein GC170_21890 [bacterium]|nr:hypothetical protein [bacterium]